MRAPWLAPARVVTRERPIVMIANTSGYADLSALGQAFMWRFGEALTERRAKVGGARQASPS